MGRELCKELWGLRSWPSSFPQPGQDWGQTSQTRPWPLFPCRLLQTSSWESPSDRSRQQRSWRAPCIFVQWIFDGYSLGSGGRNRRLAPVRERLQYFGHVRLGDQHISGYIPSYTFDFLKGDKRFCHYPQRYITLSPRDHKNGSSLTKSNTN